MNIKTLFLLLIPSFSFAQEGYPVSDIPAHLLVDADVVVRLEKTIFTIQADGDASMEETYVATILNEDGKSAAVYVGQESPFVKIKMLKGRLYNANGKLMRSSKEEDIQTFGGAAEYEFTDDKNLYLAFEHPTFPYTVEFKKKTLMKGFLGIPSSVIQSLGVSVEKWQYQLVAPAGFKFKWKGQNVDLQSKSSMDGRNVVLDWEAQNLPAQADEPYSPYHRGIYAQINFAPEEISFDGHKGDFKNWSTVGRFFYELNAGRETLSAETIAKVQALTAGKTTQEKIAALYRFMQENCRYVSIQLGIGGWQTFEAQFVEQKKYGDCKALSNYTQALLKAAGIEAWEASIFAGGEFAPDCDETFPDPNFNHVILYIPSENTWLECTSKINPAGYLGTFTANRHALLFTPEGGKLVKTPPLKPSDNFEHTQINVQVKEDGSASVQYQALCGGDRQEMYRSFALENTQEAFEKQFAQDAPYLLSKLSKLQVTANRQTPDVTLVYEAETAKYGTLSGKRIFVPLTKPRPVKRSLPANDARKIGLKMTDAYALNDTFNIQFPVGFEAENVPPNKKIESEFGRYEIQIEKLADRVRVMRYVEIRPLEVPAARYAEVRQFLLDAAKTDAVQMVLIKK